MKRCAICMDEFPHIEAARFAARLLWDDLQHGRLTTKDLGCDHVCFHVGDDPSYFDVGKGVECILICTTCRKRGLAKAERMRSEHDMTVKPEPIEVPCSEPGCEELMTTGGWHEEPSSPKPWHGLGTEVEIKNDVDSIDTLEMGSDPSMRFVLNSTDGPGGPFKDFLGIFDTKDAAFAFADMLAEYEVAYTQSDVNSWDGIDAEVRVTAVPVRPQTKIVGMPAITNLFDKVPMTRDPKPDPEFIFLLMTRLGSDGDEELAAELDVGVYRKLSEAKASLEAEIEEVGMEDDITWERIAPDLWVPQSPRLPGDVFILRRVLPVQQQKKRV